MTKRQKQGKGLKTNPNILIAGCGYIGKKVARLLAQQSVDFYALVHSASSMQYCQQQHIKARQIDLDTPQQALPVSARTILYTIPPQASGDTDKRIGIFLKALQQAPETLVLISTTGVYGDCGGAWIDETSPTRPQADRAKRRLNAEQQAQDYAQQHGCKLIILRVAGIYGVDKLPLKRIKSGEPILREEDSGFSNRIHADDLAQICVSACTSKHMNGIYNCTDGHPGTMCDYFVRIARALDLPAPPQINMQQAQQQLSAGMLSYLQESRRIKNDRLLADLEQPLQYPELQQGLSQLRASL